MIKLYVLSYFFVTEKATATPTTNGDPVEVCSGWMDGWMDVHMNVCKYVSM